MQNLIQPIKLRGEEKMVLTFAFCSDLLNSSIIQTTSIQQLDWCHVFVDQWTKTMNNLVEIEFPTLV